MITLIALARVLHNIYQNPLLKTPNPGIKRLNPCHKRLAPCLGIVNLIIMFWKRIYDPLTNSQFYSRSVYLFTLVYATPRSFETNCKFNTKVHEKAGCFRWEILTSCLYNT